jgi:hypothetical protein
LTPATATPFPSTTIPETVAVSRGGSAAKTIEQERKPGAAARISSNVGRIESPGNKRIVSRSPDFGRTSVRPQFNGTCRSPANFAVTGPQAGRRHGTAIEEAILRARIIRAKPPDLPSESIFSVEEALAVLPIKARGDSPDWAMRLRIGGGFPHFGTGRHARPAGATSAPFIRSNDRCSVSLADFCDRPDCSCWSWGSSSRRSPGDRRRAALRRRPPGAVLRRRAVHRPRVVRRLRAVLRVRRRTSARVRLSSRCATPATARSSASATTRFVKPATARSRIA